MNRKITSAILLPVPLVRTEIDPPFGDSLSV